MPEKFVRAFISTTYFQVHVRQALPRGFVSENILDFDVSCSVVMAGRWEE